MAVTSAPIESPPQKVEDRLAVLRAALDDPDDGIPAKGADNLLIGTWNVRAFGAITEKWRSGAGDSPKRNLSDVCAIAEIVKRFDVVAIQETREDLAGLRALMARLGPDWSFVVTDVGEGKAGNRERLTYIHHRKRVRSSGLAGELVLPDEWLGDSRHGGLDRQFARTPYAVSFAAGDQGFTLVTLHVLFGADAGDRTAELRTIAVWLRDRARTGSDFNRNLIALGDFNIDRLDEDPNFAALTSEGLTPPAELNHQPRTIFDTEQKKHFYDQIAWFTRRGREQLTLSYTGRANSFDWTTCLLEDMDKTAKSWHISDHYPLWCEFKLGAGGRRFAR